MQKAVLTIIFALMLFVPQHARSNSPEIAVPANGESAAFHFRENLVGFAKEFMGIPYLYASANPAKGFDCSGFVKYVFKNFSIHVPHSSKAYSSLGKQVQPKDFKVGDVLVFYGFRNSTEIGHVGIICEANGMNSKFIHSSSGKSKGVIISELNSEMYSRRFYQCIDVIGGK